MFRLSCIGFVLAASTLGPAAHAADSALEVSTIESVTGLKVTHNE